MVLTLTVVVSGTVGAQLMVPILTGARFVPTVTENVRVALKAPSLAVRVIVVDPSANGVMVTGEPDGLIVALLVSEELAV